MPHIGDGDQFWKGENWIRVVRILFFCFEYYFTLLINSLHIGSTNNETDHPGSKNITEENVVLRVTFSNQLIQRAGKLELEPVDQ